jgi:hypothetical protein
MPKTGLPIRARLNASVTKISRVGDIVYTPGQIASAADYWTFIFAAAAPFPTVTTTYYDQNQCGNLA